VFSSQRTVGGGRSKEWRVASAEKEKEPELVVVSNQVAATGELYGPAFSSLGRDKGQGERGGTQLCWTINLRPKRAFSRAATFWARRMAAMALRVKSDEGKRLPRGSDIGLPTDRFIFA